MVRNVKYITVINLNNKNKMIINYMVYRLNCYLKVFVRAQEREIGIQLFIYYFMLGW